MLRLNNPIEGFYRAFNQKSDQMPEIQVENPVSQVAFTSGTGIFIKRILGTAVRANDNIFHFKNSPSGSASVFL